MKSSLLNMISKLNETKAKYKSAEQEATQNRIASLLDNTTNFAITEAYKAIRTNIIFTLSDNGNKCKKIIMTSASPGEGKTTTCLNLAIAFAQTGSKVLVIGADLRKPRLYRHLQIERKNGLSDVLCGLIPLKAAIKHCDKYGIDCITAGQLPPNPVELLTSLKMGEIFDELSEMYDYIFIDTPPVTLVSDATAMSKYADGVIVVVRQNYTIHETLKKARNSLDFAEAKILGYILNDVGALSGSYKRYGQGSHNSYGGYSYGAGYGYGYYGYSDSSSGIEIDPEIANLGVSSSNSSDTSYVSVEDGYYNDTEKYNENYEDMMENNTKKRTKAKNKKDSKAQ